MEWDLWIGAYIDGPTITNYMDTLSWIIGWPSMNDFLLRESI